jgi:hypothetical protein
MAYSFFVTYVRTCTITKKFSVDCIDYDMKSMLGFVCLFAAFVLKTGAEEILVRAGSPVVVFRQQCESGTANVEISFESSQGPVSFIFATQPQCECLCTSAPGVDCGYQSKLSVLRAVNASVTLHSWIPGYERYCALFRNENLVDSTVITYQFAFSLSQDYTIIYVLVAICTTVAVWIIVVVLMRWRKRNMAAAQERADQDVQDHPAPATATAASTIDASESEPRTRLLQRDRSYEAANDNQAYTALREEGLYPAIEVQIKARPLEIDLREPETST